MLIFSHIGAKKYQIDIFDDFIIKHLRLVVNIIILYISDNLSIYVMLIKYAVSSAESIHLLRGPVRIAGRYSQFWRWPHHKINTQKS